MICKLGQRIKLLIDVNRLTTDNGKIHLSSGDVGNIHRIDDNGTVFIKFDRYPLAMIGIPRKDFEVLQ